MNADASQTLRDQILALLNKADCQHAIGPGHHGCTTACPDCLADALTALLRRREAMARPR